MSFDLDAFEQADLRARTARVPVPRLARWFGAGEAAEFEVRGLSSADFARAREAKKRNRNLAAIATGLAAGGAEQAAALKSALGVGGEVPDDLAYQLDVVVSGCVAPALTLPQVVRIAEHFPVEFHELAERILELSGEGPCLGEQNSCTGTTASA